MSSLRTSAVKVQSQSFMDMIRSAKGSSQEDDIDDDDEEFLMKKDNNTSTTSHRGLSYFFLHKKRLITSLHFLNGNKKSLLLL